MWAHVRHRPAVARRDDGVTPVLGSIFVLAITIVGIAVILLWGAPAIQSIQDQNAQVTMIGEFQDVRLSTLALSVPDASRTPVVVLQDGSLGIVPGTRFLVSAGLDASNPACDLHVTGWDTAPGNVFELSTANCRAWSVPGCGVTACLEVAQLKGSSRTPVGFTVAGTGPYTVTLTGSPAPDMRTGNWQIRLTNGEATNPARYAQAVIITTVMHEWDLRFDRAVYHEGGAVFSRIRESYFLEAAPALREDALGSGETVFWLRSMTAQNNNTVTGRDDYTVTLALVGSHVRTSGTAHLVRYDFSGTLGEAWCNHFLGRNDALPGTWYTGDCAAAVPTVLYDPGTAFPFEFLDAEIATSLRF